MANGIVKWFNDSKGFGFIEQEDGEKMYLYIIQASIQQVLNPSMKGTVFHLILKKDKKVLPQQM